MPIKNIIDEYPSFYDSFDPREHKNKIAPIESGSFCGLVPPSDFAPYQPSLFNGRTEQKTNTIKMLDVEWFQEMFKSNKKAFLISQGDQSASYENGILMTAIRIPADNVLDFLQHLNRWENGKNRSI
jgi:hypothetical protein